MTPSCLPSDGASTNLRANHDRAAVVVQRAWRDGLAGVLAPGKPLVEELGEAHRSGGAMPAGLDLGAQLALALARLPLGRLARSWDLLADPALLAGERISPAVDQDLQAAATLADHGTSCW